MRSKVAKNKPGKVRLYRGALIARTVASGFTLIELLVVIAILGIIATILVPQLLDSLNKAHQKKSLADIRSLGMAMRAFQVDEAGAAAAGASYWFYRDYRTLQVSHAELTSLLVTGDHRYINEVPKVDGWGNQYFFAYGTVSPFLPHQMAIVSCGRAEPGQCRPEIFYPYEHYNAKLYNNHIVWADGDFFFFPGGDGTSRIGGPIGGGPVD